MTQREIEKLAADVRDLEKFAKQGEKGGPADDNQRAIASVVVRLAKLLAPYLETM